MPKPTITTTSLDRALDVLEDFTSDSGLMQAKSFQLIQNVLLSGESINIKTINRLLVICEHDLREGNKHTMTVLNILSETLKRIKVEVYTPPPDLMPSALAVLNTTKCCINNMNDFELPLKCFEVLLAYPNDTLIKITNNSSADLLYIIDNLVIVKIQVFNMIGRLLNILPPNKKSEFVKDGLSIWFSKVLPEVISYLNLSSSNSLKAVEVFEMLTDELVSIDYTDNVFWHSILKSIYTPNGYSVFMKNLLDNGNEYWHRLWIIFVRLLKHQITMTKKNTCSPINCMLPVVENAFKMDVTNRCRAFQCWKALIDNLSSDKNDSYVTKGIKLLMVPLKLNNAKVEAVVQAKFEAWWNLILRFQFRMDKLAENILIPFLYFCFGKQISTDKMSTAPTFISNNVKKQCTEALVEMIGHKNCKCCVSVPRLNAKLVNTQLLVYHWRDWIHSLTTVFKLACSNPEVATHDNITCMWSSFVMTISELPNNNIRNDLVNELMEVLGQLVQNCQNSLEMSAAMFDILIKPFILHNTCKLILKIDDENVMCAQKLIFSLSNPGLHDFYQSLSSEDLVIKLRPLTDLIIQERVNNQSQAIEHIFKDLPSTDGALFFWIAFVQSVNEMEHNICATNLNSILLYPLKSINGFTNVDFVGLEWYYMYNIHSLKVCNTDITKEILSYLKHAKFNPTNINFCLSVILAILKQSMLKNSDIECEMEIELLLKLMDNVKDYDTIKKTFHILVDALLLLITKITEFVNVILAKHALSTLKFTIELIIRALKSQKSDEYDYIFYLENLLKPLEVLFKTEVYKDVRVIILDELVECTSVFIQKSSLQNIIVSLLKTFLSEDKEINSSLEMKLKTAIYEMENMSVERETVKTSTAPQPINNDVNNFSVPELKVKKAKKKEASIVNTVVENGEEYVVVKSNWKFNPKKLTDKQKEKLQRKREDIPALYQDLSQSQEEFKLSSWKTDSQDTSTSKSASKSENEDVATILKHIPSSEVVPKILENIMSENVKKQNETPKQTIGDTNKSQDKQVVKSPHIALKDRVFRNVRNLIEKSTVSTQNKNVMDNLNHISVENIPKTPSMNKKLTNFTNSAPSKISTERPSRLKRTPKKFDDSEIYPLKKRRLSLSQNDSQRDCEMLDEFPHQNNTETVKADVGGINNLVEVVEVNTFEGIEKIKETESTIIQLNNDSMQQDTQCLSAKDNELIKSSDTVNYSGNKSEMTDNAISTVDEIAEKESELKELEVNSNSQRVIDAVPTISEQNISTKDEDRKEDQSTPTYITKKKSLIRKSSNKKSRIEKELAIDMVEGHPFLKGSQSEKRITRKHINSALSGTRRRSLTEKLNKTKVESKFLTKPGKISKTSINDSEKSSSEDLPSSEDIIESSQDSTITTIPVRSIKMKQAMVVIKDLSKNKNKLTQNVLKDNTENIQLPNNCADNEESKDDTDLPQNRTADEDKDIDVLTGNIDIKFIAEQQEHGNLKETADLELLATEKIHIEEKASLELTENMDTEPICDKQNNISVVDTECISTEDSRINLDEQDTANADTQPTDSLICSQNGAIDNFVANNLLETITSDTDNLNNICKDTIEISTATGKDCDEGKKEDSTVTNFISENDMNNTMSSPLKDDDERKKNFLNATLEISPIKTLSPIRDKKTPSPENSNDFVVIKLSSPVQSNGEPFDTCSSPEIFTEEKISPDKRDESPPREEIIVNNTSPNSSLSLKKNRPQMRTGRRAAQMLGLCVPEKLQTIITSERFTESEESKKSLLSSTSARRNLRILYNSVGDGSNDTDHLNENEYNENFLKLKKTLPSADCSPSVPILKRKLADIVDDATSSPASKRKRVSFHDPPVSTTVVIQKYLEPSGPRSPSNSSLKRQERQNRFQTKVKSAKRLDNAFKLESVLTKTVESFSDMESPVVSMDDIEISSLEQTPDVEIIKISELNDVDPICPELVDCKDPIENIATELSSLTMKSLLIKELEGKVETIGDLAKLTELEVNRLCIKAPKVKVAKKVLIDYKQKKIDMLNKHDEEFLDVSLTETNKDLVEKSNIEVQTVGILTEDVQIQTNIHQVTFVETQTDNIAIACSSTQTDESGNKSTADIIKSCLSERPDTIGSLNENLDISIKQAIAESLPLDVLRNIFTTKAKSSSCSDVLNIALEIQDRMDTSTEQTESQLQFLQKYLYDKFDLKQLIILFNQLLLKKIE